MKKNVNFLIVMFFLLVTIFSCKKEELPTENNKMTYKGKDVNVLVEKIFTAEEQNQLTPKDVIDLLIEGNERFMNNDLTARDHSAQVRNSTYGQYPKAIVLSCIDSRVPVEDIFDKGIGDMFVARVAGNFVNEDILGSMEYSCKVAGSKLIVVLGHEHCGAVKATIDDVKLGNITAMLAKIKPAIEMASDYSGEKTSKNKEYVHLVCENNVKNTINQIRKNSPILREMEEKGQIKIVGAIYDMSTGKINY